MSRKWTCKMSQHCSEQRECIVSVGSSYSIIQNIVLVPKFVAADVKWHNRLAEDSEGHNPLSIFFSRNPQKGKTSKRQQTDKTIDKKITNK